MLVMLVNKFVHCTCTATVMIYSIDISSAKIAHDISHCIENLAILKIIVSCTIVVKFNFPKLEVLFSITFEVLFLIIK